VGIRRHPRAPRWIGFSDAEPTAFRAGLEPAPNDAARAIRKWSSFPAHAEETKGRFVRRLGVAVVLRIIWAWNAAQRVGFRREKIDEEMDRCSNTSCGLVDKVRLVAAQAGAPRVAALPPARNLRGALGACEKLDGKAGEGGYSIQGGHNAQAGGLAALNTRSGARLAQFDANRCWTSTCRNLDNIYAPPRSEWGEPITV